MKKHFGTSLRLFKISIPFANLIIIASKQNHSFMPFRILIRETNWATNSYSVLEGKWSKFQIEYSRGRVLYSIDFVQKNSN